MPSVISVQQPARRVEFDRCDELLTVEDMAGLLGTSPNTVRRLCHGGQLPAVHIGRRWYVHRDKFAEMLGVS